ncbi:MAG: class I SAM-dependent methyltransferase [Burkholderiales bacterium]|nr:class I SAM-dependent methyltransferase [Burkholderiales bacterium]
MIETVRDEVRVLWRLLAGQPRRGTHAHRLDRFYGPQAAAYDRTREHLLHGKRLLVDLLDLPPDAHVVELGAGTGALLDLLGPRVAQCRRIDLVDLCEPLLAVARQRAAGHPGVHVAHADATRWQPDARPDVVVLSYALTMIPDWYAAIDHALAMLAPGGVLAVADFHVSRRDPPPGFERHGAFTRHFWPMWFGHDGVRPNPDHLPYLAHRCRTLVQLERRGSVPWLPGVRVPFYVFIGRPR